MVWGGPDGANEQGRRHRWRSLTTGAERRCGSGRAGRSGVEQSKRVVYVYVIKKVASYVYAMEKFSSTCMPRTRSSLTYMPFWMDGELTQVLEGV
jgi:hypothetical protein